MPLRVTFLWDEDAAMSYDEMFDRLMDIGAYDIEDEEVEEVKHAQPKSKKKESK